MKSTEEFMEGFMETLHNMKEFQGVILNSHELNYEDFERAFSEEKKIVATYDSVPETPLLEDKGQERLLTKKQ